MGRRAVGVCAALVMVVVVGWGAAIASHALRFYHSAYALGERGQAVARDLASIESDSLISATAVHDLREGVGEVLDEAEALQGLTEWLTDPIARQGVWPALAVRAEFAHEALSAFVKLADTAWWVLLEIESDLETAGQVNWAPGVPVPMEGNTLARAARATHQNRSKVVAASVSLERMGAIAPEIRWASRWQAACHQISVALDGLAALAATVCDKPDVRVLLVLQNSDEVRASGGFISAVAMVHLREMRLEGYQYFNSYDVESYRQAHPSAPLPLQEHMDASILLFRDANWAADFSESAEVMAALYTLDMGERVDAVVACNTAFLALLLDALGPVPVPEYETTLTAENVVDTAVMFWERPLGATSIEERGEDFRDWLTHRKDFGGAALGAVVARLQGLGSRSLWRFLQAMTRAVDEGLLLAWVPDNPLAQSDLIRMGIAGQVQMTGDADMMVVDSNVGWNKVDRHIDRQVDYVLTSDEGGWQAEVHLTYTNNASVRLSQCEHRSLYQDSYEALTQQCYWDYVRLLAPAQSVLQKAAGLSGPVDQGIESGQRVFGFLVVVPPGEQRTVSLGYHIPEEQQASGDDAQRLTLSLQAQPGVRRDARVWVRPDGAVRAVELPPGWFFKQGRGFYWSGEILRDETVTIGWQD